MSKIKILIKTICISLLLLLYSCNNSNNPIVTLPIPVDSSFITFCNFDDSIIEEWELEKFISEIVFGYFAFIS